MTIETPNTPSATRILRRTHSLAIEQFRRLNPDLLSYARAFRLERGEPMDFDSFPFQKDILRDFGDRELEHVIVQKSVQCGLSATGVSLALYAPDIWGVSVLYVLPTEDMAQDFSDTRVKRAIEDSPYLSSRITSTDAKGLKRVGDAYVYFSGSGSENQALSIPADILILDELDRLDQRQVPKFEKRLASPKSLRLRRFFSNPSYPETGIHSRFLASDQREWLVRCQCTCEAAISWASGHGHFVDEERGLRLCGACKRELKPAAIAAGRWVPASPGVSLRGYHVSRLIVPGEDIPALVATHQLTSEDEVTAHFNFDLGLPYAPRGGSLSRELVLACRRNYQCPDSYWGPSWVTAGVDVGKVLHVRISRHLSDGKVLPLYLGEVADFSELALLWSRYNVKFGLIDERPEERAAREFLDAHRGRCLLLRWASDEQRDPVVVDEEHGLVIARRTGACDRLVAQISEQKRLLARDLPKDYVSQMSAPHRIAEQSSKGQKISRYRSDGRADHYFFAETHDLIAREVRRKPVFAHVTIPPTPITRRHYSL